MRPPGFWANPPGQPGLAARALAPLAWIWTRVTARRLARAPKLLPDVPVICVGNINIGGTGKTPVVSYLLERAASQALDLHAVSRGYGGSESGPLRVDPKRHSAAEVGDEPLLLAGFGPTWVARDRAAGVRAATAAGAQAIVLDDGFQNPDVAKALSVLVVDAAAGFGNGRVIPAGPLREPVASGLTRADLVLALGAMGAQARLAEHWPEVATHAGLLEGTLRPLLTGMPWAGLRCMAFAGIGRPEKFFDTLRATGAEVVATRAFADHAVYPRAMLDRLLAEAKGHGAQLVTTEKDAVRLPDDVRRQVLTLPVRLALEDPVHLDAALARVIPNWKADVL